MQINPFTPRDRITDPQQFIGRWVELSQVFDALDARRPALLYGGARIGRSSLLSHLVAAAPANLDDPTMRAYYLDVARADSASHVYTTLTRALRSSGDTTAALDVAVIEAGARVLIALDNLDAALAAGWGSDMLEALARIARSGTLLVTGACRTVPPPLSEPVMPIRIGAFSKADLALLTDAYLGEGPIRFTPEDRRAVAQLTALHPAAVQIASFHLFRTKTEPEYDWRAAARAEASNLGVPTQAADAPAFLGERGVGHPLDGTAGTRGGPQTSPQTIVISAVMPLLLLCAVIALVLLLLSNNLLLALLVGGGGALLVLLRRRA